MRLYDSEDERRQLIGPAQRAGRIHLHSHGGNSRRRDRHLRSVLLQPPAANCYGLSPRRVSRPTSTPRWRPTYADGNLYAQLTTGGDHGPTASRLAWVPQNSRDIE